jgi:drug/metabolite transporter (DMT)-like permease
MKRDERRGLLYVALAVFFFSTSPVFIVWADPIHPFVKTWGRMLVAALAVGGLAWLTRSKPGDENIAAGVAVRSRGNSTLRFLAYGLAAALHFLFYISALSFTTAAHALSLVYTAPIFVALLSALFLKERLRHRQWAGIGITVLGVAILAGLEPRMDLGMAFGDLLALCSAIMFGFYSVAGRYERERYPLLVYASRVYWAATLWLVPLALFGIPQTPPGAWDWTKVGAIVAVGVLSGALGHTLYNASLRRVHAAYVNIIASQEVTGGIILSWIFLSQVPTANSIAGALVTLVGIGLVLR